MKVVNPEPYFNHPYSKPTTRTEEKPESTYDIAALSKVTVFSVAKDDLKIISPLATFVMEQTQNEPKTLATLQKSYQDESDVRVTLPDLFTYCQLLERRKLVKISVQNESSIEDETLMDQDSNNNQASLQKAEVQRETDLPETLMDQDSAVQIP